MVCAPAQAKAAARAVARAALRMKGGAIFAWGSDRFHREPVTVLDSEFLTNKRKIDFSVVVRNDIPSCMRVHMAPRPTMHPSHTRVLFAMAAAILCASAVAAQVEPLTAEVTMRM